MAWLECQESVQGLAGFGESSHESVAPAYWLSAQGWWQSAASLGDIQAT
jgi:hypothetical protein